MKLSNQLVKLPQLSQTMQAMSMEMTKVRPTLLRAHEQAPNSGASTRREEPKQLETMC